LATSALPVTCPRPTVEECAHFTMSCQILLEASI
jgi:hypothetical protein